MGPTSMTLFSQETTLSLECLRCLVISGDIVKHLLVFLWKKEISDPEIIGTVIASQSLPTFLKLLG